MQSHTDQVLQTKRKRWRLSKDLKIRERSTALKFIDDLGFVAVVSDKVLPSFYDAVFQSDEIYGHFFNSERVERMWNLTHYLASEKLTYYGKLIGKKNLLISMNLFPDVLQLHPIPDYNELYWAGDLRKMGKDVMDILSEEGRCSTPDMQTFLGLQKDDKREFQSVLVELQSQALICCAGTEVKGGAKWGSTIWDTMERWVPEDTKVRAASIPEFEARIHIVERFVYAAVQTNFKTIKKYFGWSKKETEETIDHLVNSGVLSEKNGLLAHLPEEEM